MHPSIHPSIHPFIHSPIFPFIHRFIKFIHPFTHPSIHPSISTIMDWYFAIFQHRIIYIIIFGGVSPRGANAESSDTSVPLFTPPWSCAPEGGSRGFDEVLWCQKLWPCLSKLLFSSGVILSCSYIRGVFVVRMIVLNCFRATPFFNYDHNFYNFIIFIIS